MRAFLMTEAAFAELPAGDSFQFPDGEQKERPRPAQVPCWCIYHDGEWNLLDCIPFKMAKGATEAIEVAQALSDAWSAGYAAGRAEGRRQVQSELHELLGINRIADALERAGKGDHHV
jgi:hypothetical protein